MARKRKAPPAMGIGGGARGTHSRGSDLPLHSTLELTRLQMFAARYGLAIEFAAIVAPLALGGAHG